MNHWFLCARDIMWFLFGCFPICAATIGGVQFGNQQSNDDGATFMVAAFLIQWVLIAMLYSGVIK